MIYLSQVFQTAISRAAHIGGRAEREIVRDLVAAHHLRVAQDGGKVAPLDGMVIVHSANARPAICSLELADGRIFVCAFVEWTPALLNAILNGRTPQFAAYPLQDD